jgi:heat shock protein HslJ
MRARLAAALLAGLTLVLLGCTSTDTTGGSLVGSSWSVVSIAGAPTILDARPSMAFGQDGVVSGSTGCNAYNGQFLLDGDKLQVGALASTMMACEPARNAQEQAFTLALTGATNWQLAEDGSLEIRGRSDMVAKPAADAPSGSDAAGSPAPGLPGTSWVLAAIGDTPVADVVPTLAFGADGTASGNAGCNTYNGTFAIDGATISFGPLISTKMACEGAANTTEQAYLGALQGASSWTIDADGRLILDGADPLTFQPA